MLRTIACVLLVIILLCGCAQSMNNSPMIDSINQSVLESASSLNDPVVDEVDEGSSNASTKLESDVDDNRSESSEDLDLNLEGEDIRDQIWYREGTISVAEWEGYTEYSVEEVCVPDMDTALKFGQIILENCQKQGKYIGYIPISVYNDIEARIWVISYAEDTELVGACFTIAIRYDNAEVVFMSLGE